MTGAQYAALSSAALGAIGTIILFFSSYSLQPLEGGVFGSDALTKYNNDIKIKNANRLLRQRIGFAFLCLSFAVQAVSVFL
jgi:hypothetical protein